MRKMRFSCPVCYRGFTRFWNMQRHCEELHNVMIPKVNSTTPLWPRRRQDNLETSSQSPKRDDSTNDSLFRPIFDAMKISKDYAKSMPPLPDTGYLNNLNRSLQEELNLRNRELEDIRLNHWVLPNREIEGVSGYFCRRCRTMGFRPIRDIGYDRTAQAKHRCDENKVRTLIMVACREIDHWNEDNSVARELLKSINSLFKGNKFLVATDISAWFETFKTIKDQKAVYDFLGIQERYPIHFLRKDQRLDWVTRAIKNLDTKLIVTDDEIMDFLRRLKSTYGVIETYNGPNLTRILMRIVS
jgi:hypothetical protein